MAFGTGGLGAAVSSGFARPRAEPATRNSARSRHRARAAMAAGKLPSTPIDSTLISLLLLLFLPARREGEELDLLRPFFRLENFRRG